MLLRIIVGAMGMGTMNQEHEVFQNLSSTSRKEYWSKNLRANQRMSLIYLIYSQILIAMMDFE